MGCNAGTAGKAAATHYEANPAKSSSQTSSDGGPEPKEVVAQQVLSLKAYWQAYSLWLGTWPLVREAQEASRVFSTAWDDISVREACLGAFVCVAWSGASIEVSSKAGQGRTGKFIAPGQCVLVESVEEINGVRHLKLKEGDDRPVGWVCETEESPEDSKKDRTPVMLEMTSVETGNWWHRVVCKEFVEVRKGPDFNTPEARSGWVMCPREVTVVCVRCFVDGIQWLQLADGRGWVFEEKPAPRKNTSAQSNAVLQECDADLLDCSSPNPGTSAPVGDRGSDERQSSTN